MSLSALITTAIYDQCEPERAFETLDDLRSEVDDKVEAVCELIVTKILLTVLAESNLKSTSDEETAVHHHLANARKQLFDTGVIELHVREFTSSNQELAHYVPTVQYIEESTTRRFTLVADEIRAFVPKEVDLTDAIEFDEEQDFEAFLREQEKMLRRGKLSD